MSSQPMPLLPELCSCLKKLSLGQLIVVMPERLLLAEKQKLDFQELFVLLLNDEISRRESTSAIRRSRAAGLDPTMMLENWDPRSKVSYDKRVFAELCSLRFIEAKRNIVVLGPVGVGKTFLATALGHIACRYRYQVLFYRADEMLRKLKQSRFDNPRDVLMNELSTVDLLIIDDFALKSMNRDESRDIYQLFVERTGHASTIVTSNRDTNERLATFDDVLLAQSAVDRLSNSAYDLIIEGESYRPQQKPKVSADDPPPETPVTKPLLPIKKKRRR